MARSWPRDQHNAARSKKLKLTRVPYKSTAEGDLAISHSAAGKRCGVGDLNQHGPDSILHAYTPKSLYRAPAFPGVKKGAEFIRHPTMR